MSGKLKRGLVQVYTGDGKGKTTAAFGLALRAVGRGLKVIIIQFMKGRGYGEHLAAARLAPELEVVQVGKPYFIARQGELDEEQLASLGQQVQTFAAGDPPAEYRELVREGMDLARECLTSGRYDLVILDELNVAVHYELTSIAAVLELIAGRREEVELVITGRAAPPELIARADLVTEMRAVKHYYDAGVQARLGIEH